MTAGAVRGPARAPPPPAARTAAGYRFPSLAAPLTGLTASLTSGTKMKKHETIILSVSCSNIRAKLLCLFTNRAISSSQLTVVVVAVSRG